MTKKAIIIAAGRGSRLMPYTDQMPKCMVPVNDQSILGIQLDAMAQNGVTDVVVIRGYKGDVLEARRDELPLPVRFVDNDDWEHNNILESLFCAGNELEGDVLLSYSDIIYTPAVVEKLLADDGDMRLVIDRDFRNIYEGRTDHPLDEAEVATVNEGRVAKVGKRSVPAATAWGEYIGLCRISAAATTLFRDHWASLRERYRDRENTPYVRAAQFRRAYLTDFLQELIDSGNLVTPVEIRGQWREIDTVQDLQRARAMLRSSPTTWI